MFSELSHINFKDTAIAFPTFSCFNDAINVLNYERFLGVWFDFLRSVKLIKKEFKIFT